MSKVSQEKQRGKDNGNTFLTFAIWGCVALCLFAFGLWAYQGFPKEGRPKAKKEKAKQPTSFDCGNGVSAKMRFSISTKDIYIETSPGVEKTAIAKAFYNAQDVYGPDADRFLKVKPDSRGGYTVTVSEQFKYESLPAARLMLESIRINSCL